jgi:RimJ/RimL family protein N-acetyltransferase
VGRRERVALRTVEREDIPFLSRANANPDVRYPIGWDVKNQTQLDAEFDDLFGHDDHLIVCLDGEGAGPGPADPEDVERIGSVFAAGGERSRPAIGYWIVPERHGAGYGTEAVSFLIDYLFRVYPHPAISAKTRPDNDASRGLLESLGFTQEGRLRRAAFWDGEYLDTIHYGLLREEWQARD